VGDLVQLQHPDNGTAEGVATDAASDYDKFHGVLLFDEKKRRHHDPCGERYPRWVVTTIARLLFVSIGQPPISAQGNKHRKQDAADTTPALFLFLCGYSAKLPTFDQIFLNSCFTISHCTCAVILFINRKGEILGKR